MALFILEVLRVLTLLALGISAVVLSIMLLRKYKLMKISFYKNFAIYFLIGGQQGLWSGSKYIVYLFNTDLNIFFILHYIGMFSTFLGCYIMIWIKYTLKRDRSVLFFTIGYSWFFGWMIIETITNFPDFTLIVSNIGWVEYIALILIGSIFLIEFGRVVRSSSPDFKRIAIKFFFFVSLTTILPLPLDFLGLTTAPKNICVIIGEICIVYYLLKYPQLFHFSDYKVFRILVMNINSGIPLYTYIWRPLANSQDEILLSGMIQGVSGILQEGLNQGQVNEIKLDRGELLFSLNQTKEIGAALIVSRSNLNLKSSLDKFTNAFYQEFQLYLSKSGDMTEYQKADKLINLYFSFVPKFRD